MKKYAVLDIEGKVANVIIATSLTNAESLTSAQCIEVTSSTGQPHIGLGYADNTFEQPAIEESEDPAP